MEKTLLVGHDSIEFGWNIMTWIPRVRYKAQEYQETVVITKPGSEYLYADITDKFEYFGGNLKCDRWLYHGKMVVIPKHIKKKYRDADKLIPSWKNCMTSRREYVRYGEFDDDLTYGLVIHARASTKYRSKDRNWSVAKYREVWKALGKPRACSIGTEAFHIPGTADKRNIPIKELCDIMRSSKVMIGPSSGPCHLSNLCGLPLVVWSTKGRQKVLGTTNRGRYAKKWHPFDTPVTMIDRYSWKPPVDAVVKAVKKMRGL